MEFPSQTRPALWGAAGGAVALAILGFTWGGWVTGGTAHELANARAEAAVVAALAPICVNKFQLESDSSLRLAELKKASSWQRGDYVEKGGWATTAGSTSANSAVARACAEALVNGKLAAK